MVLRFTWGSMVQMVALPKPPVAGFVPDLMDRSKVAAAAPGAVFVSDPADLAATEADVVVLDLGRTGAIEALASLAGRRTIGFASHVDAELIAAAQAAGCSVVLPRSRFFAGLPDVLA